MRCTPLNVAQRFWVLLLADLTVSTVSTSAEGK